MAGSDGRVAIVADGFTDLFLSALRYCPDPSWALSCDCIALTQLVID